MIIFLAIVSALNLFLFIIILKRLKKVEESSIKWDYHEDGIVIYNEKGEETIKYSNPLSK